MATRLLILLLEGGAREELEAAVEERGGGYPSIYVVAPARVGALDWLATDEERAHGEAGEADPVLAVEDALRRFDADEIVAVGTGEVDAELLAALRRLGPPVSTGGLVVRPVSLRGRLRSAARGLSSGRSTGTPFVAFVGANLGLLLFAIVFALVGAAIIWLVQNV